MDKIEHLEMVYNSYIASEPEIRNKITTEKNGEYFFIHSFEGNATVHALYAMYLRGNYSEAKEFFYKAASVAEYMSINYDTRIIDSGINQISYALLSDNKELIHRYPILKNSINHELNIGFQLPNAVQNILLGNWGKLADNIRNLERFVVVPRFKWWVATVEVLRGFLNKDPSKIEEALQVMIKTHKKRNTDPLISKFFSDDTAGFCKLSWLQGYDIDLKNPLVPNELMPVEPLVKYDVYDFIKQ